jgi:hypothetical protein
MYVLPKGLAGAIVLGIFGLFLIWNGITGNVIKTIDGEAVIPRWMYIFGGVLVLIFPTTWILVRIIN